jgi:UPF0755 protein
MKKFFFFLLALFYFLYFVYSSFLPVDKDDKNFKIFEINKGDTVKKISFFLEKEKIIKNRHIFYWYLRFKKLDNKIKVGKYEFNSSFDLVKVANKIVEGGFLNIDTKITFKEGLRIVDIANILDSNLIVTKEEFLKEAKYSNFKDLISFTPYNDSLEGLLYPDTYFFNETMSAKDIIKIMILRFNELVSKNKDKLKIKNPKYSFYEMLILSSIVEKEAMKNDEKSKIASVFMNRLEKNIKLQSCATINFLFDFPKKNLTLDDLKIDSEYNTYLINYLPPTPISSTSIFTMIETFNYDDTDYLYFVSNGDGTHNFSKTLKQHNQFKKELKKKN